MQKTEPQVHQNLNDLLIRKIEAFENYYTSTVLLGRTLAEKDVKKINTLVNSRENQINNISLIDQEIQKITPGQLSCILAADKNLSGLLLKLEQIIKKTQNIDSSCMSLAATALKENSNDLMSVSIGLNTFNGGGKKQSPKSRFLDIRT